MKAIKYIFYTATLSLLIVLLVLASLPFTLPFIAHQLAAQYDIQLQIDSADIDWPLGKITLQDISFFETDPSRASEIGELSVDVNLNHIVDGSYPLLDLVKLSHARFHVTQLANDAAVASNSEKSIGPLLFGDINLDRFSSPDNSKEIENSGPESDTKASSDQSLFARAAINKFHIYQLQLDYSSLAEADDNRDSETGSSAKKTTSVTIHLLELDGLDRNRPDSSSRIDLNTTLAGANFNLEGTGKPFVENPTIDGLLRIANFSIEEVLSAISILGIAVPDEMQNAAGNINLRSHFKISALTTAASKNDLSQTNNYPNKFDIVLSTFSSEGRELAFRQKIPNGERYFSGHLPLQFDQLELSLPNNHYNISGLSINAGALKLNESRAESDTEVSLSNAMFSLDQLSSLQPDKASQIQLDTALGKYGKISVNAQLPVFADQPDGEFLFEAEQLQLSPYNAYLAQAIGKHIEKGALDIAGSGKIVNGKLNAQLALQAHQLSLNSRDVSTGNNSVFEAEMGMPVNTALNLLRDKHDTIALDIPIQGSVTDPEFKLTSVFNKAIFNAVKTAVTTQFGPLMLVAAYDQARSLRDALKLKPLIFSTRNSSLQDENIDSSQREKIDTIVTLLKKRPHMTLNICGLATAADTNKSLTSAKKQLLALAEERAASVKDVLISEGVEGKRLILCAPAVDQREGAVPRVELSL